MILTLSIVSHKMEIVKTTNQLYTACTHGCLAQLYYNNEMYR